MLGATQRRHDGVGADPADGANRRNSRIVQGTSAQAPTSPQLWHWPCIYRRRVQYGNELGTVNAYATRPPAEQIFLTTSRKTFSLSPVDAAGFIATLQERYALGAARQVQMEIQRPPLWTWSLWRDKVALFLIGAGLLGVVLLFGMLSFRFPYLSSDLPLHFDVNGVPTGILIKDRAVRVAGDRVAGVGLQPDCGDRAVSARAAGRGVLAVGRDMLKAGTASFAVPTLVSARALGARRGPAQRNGARRRDRLRRPVRV